MSGPLSPIDVFAPWAGDEERDDRLAIHKARDAAQARAMRSQHSQARNLYWEAAELAGRWVFKRAPIEELKEIRRALSWLFLAAGVINRLEPGDD